MEEKKELNPGVAKQAQAPEESSQEKRMQPGFVSSESQKKPDRFAMFQEEVELPSLGKFYGDKLLGGKVVIRPITVQEEKLMVSARDRVGVIDKVLDRCLVTRALSVDDYLMTDKFFLVLNLRTLSYGPDYTFLMTCISCKNEFKHHVRLPEGLRKKVASDDDVEPFEVHLPVSNKTLTCRFLRGHDEKAVDQYVKSTDVVSEGDPAYAYRLSCGIVTIDGQDPGLMQKLAFCENMLGKDSLALRTEFEKRQTGIDLRTTAICPACQYENTTLIEFTTEFFRPGVQEGLR